MQLSITHPSWGECENKSCMGGSLHSLLGRVWLRETIQEHLHSGERVVIHCLACSRYHSTVEVRKLHSRLFEWTQFGYNLKVSCTHLVATYLPCILMPKATLAVHTLRQGSKLRILSFPFLLAYCAYNNNYFQCTSVRSGPVQSRF